MDIVRLIEYFRIHQDHPRDIHMLVSDPRTVELLDKMRSQCPGSDIYVYIENNTSSALTVQAVDVSVNSFVADPHYSCRIVPGKVAYSALTFPPSAPADSTDITDLKMRFLVVRDDTQETVVDTGLVSVNLGS